jgi:hypothetical protein
MEEQLIYSYGQYGPLMNNLYKAKRERKYLIKNSKNKLRVTWSLGSPFNKKLKE